MMILSLPVGDSRRRRRLKRTGAVAPVLTGVWGRLATSKRASVYTEALLATMVTAPKGQEKPVLFIGCCQSYNGKEPD